MVALKRKAVAGSWLDDIKSAVEAMGAMRFCPHMAFSHLKECVEFGDVVIAYLV